MNEKNDILENIIAASTLMVVHDIQVHLQGMSKAEILADSVKTGKLDADEVNRELNELIGMIRITNLSLNNFAMQRRPAKEDRIVDLDRIAHDTIELFTPLARQKRLSIKYSNQSSTQPLVRASVAPIQQAVYNVMQNAIAYSDRSSDAGPPNNIELTLTEENAGRYVLKIRNVGRALQSDEIDQLFAKGFRGTTAMREHRSGAGLGLWMARTIVREYGGDLSIESNSIKSGAFLVTVSMSFTGKTATEE